MFGAPTTPSEPKRAKNVPVGEDFHGSRVYTPLRAIRLKCLDGCGGSQAEVRACAIPGCTLWPYRTGHRPKAGE